MEITIPIWAVVIFGSVFIPWLVWITLKVSQNEKDIAVNTANDAKVGSELEKIYKAIDDQRSSLNNAIEKLERKLDMFIANEIAILKEAIKR